MFFELLSKQNNLKNKEKSIEEFEYPKNLNFPKNFNYAMQTHYQLYK